MHILSGQLIQVSASHLTCRFLSLKQVMVLAYIKWKVMKVWGKFKAVQYAPELTIYFLVRRHVIILLLFYPERMKQAPNKKAKASILLGILLGYFSVHFEMLLSASPGRVASWWISK